MTYLTTRQVCELLQITSGTLKRYSRLGKIPAYRVAGVRGLRFEQADVIGLLVPVEPRNENDDREA